MGWFVAGLVVGWFVPQPDWKVLGSKVWTMIVTRGLK